MFFNNIAALSAASPNKMYKDINNRQTHQYIRACGDILPVASHLAITFLYQVKLIKYVLIVTFDHYVIHTSKYDNVQ